jgi:pyruvate carboxylase subunit B
LKYFVSVGDREVEVEVEAGGLRVNGREVRADLVEMDGSGLHSLLLGDRSFQILTSQRGPGEWVLHMGGHRLEASAVDERTRAIREMTGAGEGSGGPRALQAPMPGLVVKIEVVEGDEVDLGQGLVIVEAMKMENELKAEGPGRVGRILVETGQAVEKDQVLIEFEAEEVAAEEESTP